MQNFGLFLLFLFFIAAALKIDFFLTIVYLFFAVYLFSRLWVSHGMGRLRAERRFADHAFFGDRVTIDLTVRNTSLLPLLWLEIHESLPVHFTTPPFYEEVVTLPPRGQRRFQYTLHCRQRGYYNIGPLTARTGDLLGTMRPMVKEVASEPIIVYPRVVPVQKLGLPTHSPLVALPARSPLFEDPARVRGVRDYQRGDSPRRIHWTATASAGRLLVKQYQPAIARETLICLDLDRDDYSDHYRMAGTELGIVAAASLANHILVRDRLAVGLATEAWDSVREEHSAFYLPPRKERGHLMNLLETLARVQITPETTFINLLYQRAVHLSWGATVVVITGKESEELFDALAYLRRTGFAVALVLARPDCPSDELRQRSALLGVPVHRVWEERELELWP